MLGLVRVARTRWARQESFQQAKGEVGLDHYEVRRWPGWYGHITSALLSHAFVAVTRTEATGARAKGGRGGGLTSQLGLGPLTVPEVRRLLAALVWTTFTSLAWCWPGHDGGAATRPAPAAHDQQREQQVRLECWVATAFA